jgi:hypothetical protein
MEVSRGMVLLPSLKTETFVEEEATFVWELSHARFKAVEPK